jgi:hypothetical protein
LVDYERTFWDRILDRRHVAFWTLLGSIAGVVSLVIALVPHNGQPASNSADDSPGLRSETTETSPPPPSSDPPSPDPSTSDDGGDSGGPVAALDFSLDANYGTFDVTTGFTPDPWMQSVTSGGSADASAAPVNCRGYAATKPDVQVNWHGTSSFLRIFFDAPAGQDTTLIVNDPDGVWHCGDDEYAPNPAIDITSPSEGAYDIWVGSYVAGEFISGTLYLTEITSTSPDTV